MSENKKITEVWYELFGGDHCVDVEDNFYQNTISEDAFNHALQEFERLKPLFDHVILTKHTEILEIETVKEKNTPHKCKFEPTDYGRFFYDGDKSKGIIQILKCKCGEKKDGERIYFQRYGIQMPVENLLNAVSNVNLSNNEIQLGKISTTIGCEYYDKQDW